MQFYDDKTEGVIKSDNCLTINHIEEADNITFKASFIIIGDLICNGKITALFDLYVIGNIQSEDMDVKGRLVCLGSCNISHSLIVQNDIWANDIVADSVICHDRVVAQDVDVTEMKADGSIVVGKTLAVEKEAKSMQSVICGETAFGAGKLIANMILTVEPLDLDDGEDALENPFVFNLGNGTSGIVAEMEKFASERDYEGYFSVLLQNSDEEVRRKLRKYKMVFNTMAASYPDGLGEYRDVSLLLLLIEIARSDYFSLWPQIDEWIESVRMHFDNLIHGKTEADTKVRPATEMKKNYVVSHTKYGRGIVVELEVDGKHTCAIIQFDAQGEKKFPIPDSLKFFKIISEKPGEAIEEIKESITCNVDNYEEWLNALVVMNENKEIIGNDLYEVIYDKLFSKIGLKAKFVQDRLREKGWEDGK